MAIETTNALKRIAHLGIFYNRVACIDNKAMIGWWKEWKSPRLLDAPLTWIGPGRFKWNVDGGSVQSLSSSVTVDQLRSPLKQKTHLFCFKTPRSCCNKWETRSISPPLNRFKYTTPEACSILPPCIYAVCRLKKLLTNCKKFIIKGYLNCSVRLVHRKTRKP